MMQSLKKTDLLFQIWLEEFGKFSHNHSKVWKFHFNGAFLSKVYKVSVSGVTFHDTEKWCEIWINSDPLISKIAWGFGWFFIRPFKSLKNCTSMGFFYPKHIMFQIEKFRGIMCHDAEE